MDATRGEAGGLSADAQFVRVHPPTALIQQVLWTPGPGYLAYQAALTQAQAQLQAQRPSQNPYGHYSRNTYATHQQYCIERDTCKWSCSYRNYDGTKCTVSSSVTRRP